jgi:hypothetical protein
MPKITNNIKIEIKAADIEVEGLSITSTTLNLPMDGEETIYSIFGAPTLTSSITIQPSGAAIKGTEYVFKYNGTINLNTNSVTLFGRTLTQNEVSSSFEARCYYDGTSWEVLLNTDSSTTEIIAANQTGLTTGATAVESFADTDRQSAFWIYYITDAAGNNVRGGKIIAVWNASTNVVNYSKQETLDIGSVTVVMSVDINSNNVRLLATVASGTWNIYCKRINL